MRPESGPVSENRKAGAGRKKPLARAGKGQRWAVSGFFALRLGRWRAGRAGLGDLKRALVRRWSGRIASGSAGLWGGAVLYLDTSFCL